MSRDCLLAVVKGAIWDCPTQAEETRAWAGRNSNNWSLQQSVGITWLSQKIHFCSPETRTSCQKTEPESGQKHICEAELSRGSYPLGIYLLPVITRHFTVPLHPPSTDHTPPRVAPPLCRGHAHYSASTDVTPRLRLRPRGVRSLSPTTDARRASQAPPTRCAGAVRALRFGPWRGRVPLK
jgi:hypothetical protein